MFDFPFRIPATLIIRLRTSSVAFAKLQIWHVQTCQTPYFCAHKKQYSLLHHEKRLVENTKHSLFTLRHYWRFFAARTRKSDC